MRNYVLLLLCLLSTNLWAADSEQKRLYAGGSLGFSELDDDGMGDHLDLDDNALAFRVFGGYQFNTYLAAEAAVDFLGMYNGETTTADLDSSYSALTLSLVGRLPLGDGLSIYAQGGMGVASIYQWVDGVIGSYYYDDGDEADSGLARSWGAGISYMLPGDESIEVRAGFLQTEFELDALSVNGTGNLVQNEYDQNIKQLYLGAAIHF